MNAGSVFLGQYSPESAGDYASGTNHSLPTYGYAKTFGGVSVEAFMKSITFQKLSLEGLENISVAVETLAEVEGLQAHKNAVHIRLKK
jgi:histidinol dehydrogenase